MRSVTIVLGVVLALTGCKTAVEAPEGLDAATKSLFTNFEIEDDEILVLSLEVLEAETADLDLTSSDVLSRTVAPSFLTHDQLGGVTHPPGTDPNNQVPVQVFGLSIHDHEANLSLSVETNHVCIESNTTKFYGRTVTEGGDCFLDGSCAFLRTENEVRKENILARAWYDMFKDYRTLELSDGRRAILARGWTEEVFLGDNGSNEFAQTFTLETWIEDQDQSKRSYAMWAEINIGLPDEVMEGTIRDGMNEGFDNADQFLSDDLSACGADRDQEYDRDAE
jgi:hypothetical protein